MFINSEQMRERMNMEIFESIQTPILYEMLKAFACVPESFKKEKTVEEVETYVKRVLHVI